MTPHTVWIIGWVLLGCMGTLSLATIALGVARAINHSSAASVVTPPRPRRPQLRVVEADAELTRETIA